MADPLSLLRQYNVSKKDIIEKNDYICFGESCWPKNVKTNYLSYGSSRDGPNKDYYTLECLHFFLRNKEMQHPAYVRQAAAQGVPVVRRPDRKDLLAYLTGESATSQSIDRSAPLELPIPLHEIQAKFGKEDNEKGPVGVLGKLGSGDAARAETAEDEGESDPKKLKIDSKHFLTEAKKQFSDRLDAPKIKKSELIEAAGGQTGAGILGLRGIGSAASSSATSLKEALTLEQIASLKAKRMAKKRMTIIDAENEFEKEGANLAGSTAAPASSLTGPSSILYKYDANVTREIQSKERVWRNRSTILVSSGKNFAKSIFPIIQAIKVREEGSSAINQRKPPGNVPIGSGYMGNQMNGPNANSMVSRIPNSTPMGGSSINPNMPPPNMMMSQQYNRYDQERFNRSAPSNEFRIDTTGSYHGFNLKNVTDIPNSNIPDMNSNGTGLNHPSTPALSKVLSSIPSPMTSVMNQSIPGSGNKKRTSKTPIIIIPSTTTSLITLANAKAILQDLKYVDSNNGDMPRDNEILIQRRKQGEITTVPYRVINNILKLGDGDWERVVAVFVQGPAWQFKGWPWDGNPVEIFSRIKAFHLKWDEMKLDTNVSKWNVEVIQLSRNKRHLDRANLLKFWSSLDTFMIKNKHYLRF